MQWVTASVVFIASSTHRVAFAAPVPAQCHAPLVHLLWYITSCHANCCSSAIFRYDPNELSMEDDSGGGTSAIKNLNFSKVSIGGGAYRRSNQGTQQSAGARTAYLCRPYPPDCINAPCMCIISCFIHALGGLGCAHGGCSMGLGFVFSGVNFRS